MWVSILLVLFLSSCGSEKDSKEVMPLSDELSLMTSEERLHKSPNTAFDAVWLRQKDQVIDSLQEERSLFLTRNGDGLTPLMVAIQLRELEMSLEIIKFLTQSELLHKDKTGRGYVSYAAEQGFLEIIEALVSKYRDSMQFPAFFRMSQLDFADEQKRRSLFYAANGSTAQRLKEFWMQWPGSRSLAWSWFSVFYQSDDIEGQIFLHTAARDNRHDTLRWAIMDICEEALWQDVEFLFGAPELIGSVWDWVTGAVQVLPIIPDDLVNRKSLSKDTPLHIAVRHGHQESARALMSCRLTRYTVENEMGRTPLAELLANIDPNTPVVSQSFKDIFDSLTLMQNRFRGWWRTLQDIINTPDFQGKTALHHSAKLRDPYFYNRLKEIGDIYLLDNNDMTPEGIFQTRQK